MTRKEACYYLGIGENASDEQIKRAYRYKAKLYHPDENPDMDTREYYIKIQRAYECLMDKRNLSAPTIKNNGTMQPGSGVYGTNASMSAGADTAKGRNMYAGMNMYMNGQQNHNAQYVRPARVYSSTAAAKASYQKQKEKEREREKLQKWDEENKNNKKHNQMMQLYGKGYTDKALGSEKSKEEEILEKIRAIWLAETIKRQIQLDREHKEALQRRNLYRAFMQQKVQEKDEKRPGDRYGNN